MEHKPAKEKRTPGVLLPYQKRWVADQSPCKVAEKSRRIGFTWATAAEAPLVAAAEDGMNTFRHWFMWSAIEIAPGVYDWDDYDRQLDLAAKNGIKTIIA